MVSATNLSSKIGRSFELGLQETSKNINEILSQVRAEKQDGNYRVDHVTLESLRWLIERVRMAPGQFTVLARDC